MKNIKSLLILAFLFTSCSHIQKNQMKYTCSDSSAYNMGKADAALQEQKNYTKYDQCDEQVRTQLIGSYNNGYDQYIKYESNQVGHTGGPAGFGANIKFVCVGTIFGRAFIGKGQTERVARQHLRYNCNASDLSVHCTSLFNRCRRVHYGKQI